MSFVKNKLQNKLKTHLDLFMKMFAQKKTHETFPLKLDNQNMECENDN
jgi:hypothetical protein